MFSVPFELEQVVFGVLIPRILFPEKSQKNTALVFQIISACKRSWYLLSDANCWYTF